MVPSRCNSVTFDTVSVSHHPTGASPFGCLDMSGNVWEWTADWYAPDSYLNRAYENPTGPEAGLQRVIRGGSWYYYGKNLRVVKRHKDTPTTQHENIGFRCVVSEMGQSAKSAGWQSGLFSSMRAQ